MSRDSNRYGSYYFRYDEAKAKQLDGDKNLNYIYYYEMYPRVNSKTFIVWHAPLDRSSSASGLYHHRDYTNSEKGLYQVMDGDKSIESGTYYYYRIFDSSGTRKSGGYGGYLSEATFYYLYFPSQRTTAGMPSYG